jgi:hypothetical protein
MEKAAFAKSPFLPNHTRQLDGAGTSSSPGSMAQQPAPQLSCSVRRSVRPGGAFG